MFAFLIFGSFGEASFQIGRHKLPISGGHSRPVRSGSTIFVHNLGKQVKIQEISIFYAFQPSIYRGSTVTNATLACTTSGEYSPSFVRVREFMSTLWVSAWLEFQCEDLPAPYATEWPRSGRLDPRYVPPPAPDVAAVPGCVGTSPHFDPPGLGTGCRAAEGSMRRPALALSSSCSTTAIAPSPRTDSRVASQLARAQGAVGAVPGLQSPTPVALHVAAPPCPLAIVPPRRGCGHGNLDFLARAPATTCVRRMWVALYFHPLPPLVLLEAGPPRPPTTAAHHRAAVAGTHACGEPGLPCAHWRQHVRRRQEVLYSTFTHSLYRAGRHGGVDWSRNARRCVDGGRQGGRSGRAICAQWSVEGRQMEH
ncbi:hypothetical protein DFH08DRAFT_802810 [Mycena albidolilacea]|uniref:Uncharacterized protein n=1 Tax=Mycena albidolilacea TaxID=1033008 RepID=A0AAD7EZU1_9AGAR|nr:hypothetical protein DFH08DRAFT_802810 [Mycena albidolilacea]